MLTPRDTAATASRGKMPPTTTWAAAAPPANHHRPTRQRRDRSGPATVRKAAVPASQPTGGNVTPNIPPRPTSSPGQVTG